MKHSNYEEIKRYIDDVENYTVISSGGEGWREVSGGYLFCEGVSVKTVAKRHLQLALDYYNGKCPDGVEIFIRLADSFKLSNNPDFSRNFKYRKVERKFEEGHWYPVVDDNSERVYLFQDGAFRVSRDGYPCPPDDFKHIGKSLGCDLHGKGE